MKKIALALTSLGLCGSLWAGRPGNEVVAPSGSPVLLMESSPYWSFGLEGLFLESGNSDFHYVNRDNNLSPTGVKNFSVSPEHHFGLGFDATYHMANSYDVKMAYSHIAMDDNRITHQHNIETFDDPFGQSTSDTNMAKGNVDINVDAMDLVFGVNTLIGSRLHLHPAMGLRFADVQINDLGRYFDTSITPAENALQGSGRIVSQFSGLGPRASLDASLFLGRGVSLLATVGASLLVGDMYTTSTVTPYEDNPTVNLYKDHTHIVPETDFRLGLGYEQAFTPIVQAGIQIGYQVVNYFSAFEDNYIDLTSPNNKVGSTDISYHGPYIRLSLDLA